MNWIVRNMRWIMGVSGALTPFCILAVGLLLDVGRLKRAAQ